MGRIKPSKPLAASPTKPSSAQPPRIVVSFRHYPRSNAMCLSDCQNAEIREYMNALRILCDMDWITACRHGGLRPKPIADTSLHKVVRPQTLDQNIPIFEFRATQTARCFGGKQDFTFFVLWFDRNHDICPD